MKTNKELGERVREYLIEKGVETPIVDYAENAEKKMTIIEENFSRIMQALGLDLNDDSLKDTPNRVAKMYLNEIFYGLNYENFPNCSKFENKMHYDEMVIERGISVNSFCEHHFVNIDGSAIIAYIPKTKVIGLSKLNRIVKFFSKRPQVQERLTEQIYHALSYILETEDIAVIIEATHHCVKSRGVEDQNCDTMTSKLGGVFREQGVRMEFFTLIKRA